MHALFISKSLNLTHVRQDDLEKSARGTNARCCSDIKSSSTFGGSALKYSPGFDHLRLSFMPKARIPISNVFVRMPTSSR